MWKIYGNLFKNFQVLGKENIRPDFDMLADYEVISKNNSIFYINTLKQESPESIFYLGILPGLQVIIIKT